MQHKWRVLIVEDDLAVLEQLVKMTARAFPQAGVLQAVTVSEAERLLADVWKAGGLLDLAVLDILLPKGPGESVERDFSLCATIRNVRGNGLVVHITGYSEDEGIQKHIAEVHANPKDPRCQAVSKGILTWPDELLRKMKAYLFACDIRDQLSFFRDCGGPGLARRRYASQRSATSRLSELRHDVAAHWDDLDPEFRELLKSHLYIDDSVRPLAVSLLLPADLGNEETGSCS